MAREGTSLRFERRGTQRCARTDRCFRRTRHDPLHFCDAPCARPRGRRAALGIAVPGQAQWQPCANQDEVCRFKGEALVRYGAEGRYAFQVARNRINCDVRDFGGDPAEGVRKRCDYNYDLSRRDTGAAPSSRGWTHCAGENEYCRVPGTARMRYGVDKRYVYRTVTGGVECSVRVFGDPAKGVNKTCDYQASGGRDDRGRGDDNAGNGRGWEYQPGLTPRVHGSRARPVPRRSAQSLARSGPSFDPNQALAYDRFAAASPLRSPFFL